MVIIIFVVPLHVMHNIPFNLIEVHVSNAANRCKRTNISELPIFKYRLVHCLIMIDVYNKIP